VPAPTPAGPTPDGAVERRRDGLRRRAAAAAQVFVAEPSRPVLEPADVHHLVRVLRLRPGEAVVAADGAGRWSLCRVRSTADPAPDTLLEVDGPVSTEPAPAPPLTVAFAPGRGDRPEWVVQKLTELGIDRIVALSTERSIVRWEGERGARALERLRRVAREASAQCRRVHLPELAPQRPLDSLRGLSGPAAGGAGALAQLGGPPPTRRLQTVAVGPEGGWSDAELEGRPTVGLAGQVLRAETAAVVAGALLAALRDGTVGDVRPGERPGPGGAGTPGAAPGGEREVREFGEWPRASGG